MKEIALPDVGKLAIIRRDPGQDRLRCYRESGMRLLGHPNGFLGVD